MKIERLYNPPPTLAVDLDNPMVMDRYEMRAKINELCFVVESLGTAIENIGKALNNASILETKP